MMKLLRKSLILTHRYMGIALSLLVVMWFATGIVMMYRAGCRGSRLKRGLSVCPRWICLRFV